MSFQDLVELMDTLRGEKGCPWDKDQTLDSLKPFLIEEAYEVIEAIEHNDPQKLKEELGDLLFHILFMSKVCSEMRKFGIEDVIKFACEKMTRRHPHVFRQQARQPTSDTQPSPRSSGEAHGTPSPRNGAEVLKQWYQMKRDEREQKGSISLMDGIPRVLPALQKAQKVQQRAAQVGFDWEKTEDVVEKISEEMQELRQAISQPEGGHISEEIGDILFSVVNLCRFLEVHAEEALRSTIARFTGRFRAMERRAAASGKTLKDLSLKEMDALWEAVKADPQATPEP